MAVHLKWRVINDKGEAVEFVPPEKSLAQSYIDENPDFWLQYSSTLSTTWFDAEYGTV